MSDNDELIRDRLRLAYGFARHSLDPSTQNGGVLFSADGEWIGEGWNRIVPSSLATPGNLSDRDRKLSLTTH